MSEMDDERAREARAGEERAASPPRLVCDDAEPLSPRLVTRGESGTERTNAFVDWLSFTVSESCYPRAAA